MTGAADGNAGLAALKNGSFDLVIADIWMPGASGATVIRQGRDRSPRTRFLAITGGHPSRRAQQNALRLEDFGADEVLEKPFEKAKLLEAVARLLRH